MSFTSNYNNKKLLYFWMAVQKKRTSISKKRIRKNIWKKKGYWVVLKTFWLAKSLSTGNSKSFFVQQIKNKKLKVEIIWFHLTWEKVEIFLLFLIYVRLFSIGISNIKYI